MDTQDTAFTFLFNAVPWALWLGVLSMALSFVLYLRAPEPKRRASGIAFILMAFVAAAIGYIIGAFSGMAVACFVLHAGNLCGLMGFFGSGPILAGLAASLYAFVWLWYVTRPQTNF